MTVRSRTARIAKRYSPAFSRGDSLVRFKSASPMDFPLYLQLLLIYTALCYCLFPVIQVLPEWESPWVLWLIAPLWLPGIFAFYLMIRDLDNLPVKQEKEIVYDRGQQQEESIRDPYRGC